MAIQNRRGSYNDFDPQKMVSGEWAVVQSNDPNTTDGKAVYMAFSTGDVKRMATYDDVDDIVEDELETFLDTTLAVADKAADAKAVGDALNEKVDVVSGKGLSTNDYTTAEKEKLAGIAIGATKVEIDSTLTVSEKAADAKSVGNNKADIIISNVSGGIAHFEDGSTHLAESVIVYIEPVQASGTQTPSSPIPIYGWTGVNVNVVGKNFFPDIPNGTYKDVTFSKNADGTYAVSGEAVSSASLTLPNVYDVTLTTNTQNDQKKHLPNGTYYANLEGEGFSIQVCGSNSSSSTIGVSIIYRSSDGDTFTIDDTYKYNWIRLLQVANTTLSSTIAPTICLATESDTSFEPHINTVYTEDWNAVAGTVYGGYIDFVSGTLNVNTVIADLGDATWTASSGGYYTSGRQSDTWLIDPGLVKRPASATTMPSILCSMYTPAVASSIVGSTPINYTIGISTNNGSFLIMDTDVESVSALKTKVTGQKVVAKINTPIVYNLTPQAIPTLLGTNNLYADTGNVEVTYRADTKLYIDGKQLDIRSTIAPIEDGATASQAYATGKFFYRNGSFCKAKTAIASGAAFTLGTNYEVTTVAAELFTALS